MKICELRFKNLNSLAGEWSVDFTFPEYTADGIFAISGPTGAGKSTILDAICLALYGRTPRLKNISASTNEIMSRQTGECYAEVVFETDEGRFRAHWGQRRARGKSGGALQQPRHEISEADENGKLLASQLTQTALMIEEKTGMDFGRFTQSMMLAQGGFTAFLQASGNERAPILEQITGTEIYSQISIHVFQQNKAEKEALERLRAESSGIMIMSLDEEEKTRTELGEKEKNKAAVDENINKLDTAIKWLEKIEMIRGEIAGISLKAADADKKNLEFAPLRDKLARAMKASNIEGEYASLNLLREQQGSETDSLQSLRKGLPSVEDAAKEAAKTFSGTEMRLTEAKTSRDSLLKITREVRLIDGEITRKEEAGGKIFSALGRLQGEIKAETEKKKEAEGTIAKLESELAEIEDYQKIHAPDAFLIAGFTGIESTLERVKESLQSIKEAGERLDSLRAQLKDKSEENAKALEKFIYTEKKHREEVNETERIKSEISVLLGGKTAEELIKRKDEIILRIAELMLVAEYETVRDKLEDGKPCPLCGSVHHPYATGNIPTITKEESELRNLIDVIEKHAALTKKAMKLSEDERKSAEIETREKAGLHIIKSNIKDLETKKTGLEADHEKARTGFEKIAKGLKMTVLPLGITEIPEAEEDFENLKVSLNARRNTWKTCEERKIAITASVQSWQPEISVSSALIKSKEEEKEEKSKEYKVLKDSINELRLKRQELFGEKNTDNEETLAEGKVSDAESAMRAVSESLNQKQQLLANTRTRISGLEERIDSREKAIAGALKEFAGSLKKNGFENETEFIKARMTTDERSALEERSRELEKEKTELDASRKASSAELERETSKNLTAEKAETLTELMEKAKTEAEALYQDIVVKSGLLRTNEDAKSRGQAIARRISCQAVVCERWSRLSSIIGSADGKKYRNFAQGLTLEIMVSHANTQLAKLSDRYLLIRNREEPLELNVVDNYQAGEIRSTKNLSGGESFIVSLALALGLSRMASRKVRVDSLFLDEGFGTLDEDTLETALGTLAGLRQDGKMIGVISHVGAMKERINTKINVIPVREGRSVIEGPGCSFA